MLDWTPLPHGSLKDKEKQHISLKLLMTDILRNIKLGLLFLVDNHWHGVENDGGDGMHGDLCAIQGGYSFEFGEPAVGEVFTAFDY